MSRKNDDLGRILIDCRALGLPEPTLEYQFAAQIGRRWRFDAAWPEYNVALEYDGGTWIGGRHVQGAGYEADCRKYAEAAILGWTVIRVTPRMVGNGEATDFIQRMLDRRM